MSPWILAGFDTEPPRELLKLTRSEWTVQWWTSTLLCNHYRCPFPGVLIIPSDSPNLIQWCPSPTPRPLAATTPLSVSVFNYSRTSIWPLRSPTKGLPFLATFPRDHFIFISSLGLHLWHMEVPRLEVNQSRSCRPPSQPQRRGIRAASVTYTTACGNARPSTHWARPGIEPESSWILVGFLTCWATTRTPKVSIFIISKVKKII